MRGCLFVVVVRESNRMRAVRTTVRKRERDARLDRIEIYTETCNKRRRVRAYEWAQAHAHLHRARFVSHTASARHIRNMDKMTVCGCACGQRRVALAHR